MVSRSGTEDGLARNILGNVSLSNIARHAHATAAAVCVDVSGRGKSGRVRITITDDGRGIDPSRTRNSGLANMAERARRHRGSFDAGSGEGGVGTQIRWIAPLEG